MKTELIAPPENYKPGSAPLTPYQLAQQEWDDRIGSARKQAANWRIMALSMVLICILLVLGLVYNASQSTVTPYVVQVNGDGIVQTVGPAKRANYVPNKKVVEYFLVQWITWVRSTPLDPIVARNQWITAYAYLRQSAATALNGIAIKEQPLSKIGVETVSVQAKNIVALSANTYQVRWAETTTSREGTLIGTREMTGVFNIELDPPTDEKKLKQNPLGLFIKQFSWSRDL